MNLKQFVFQKLKDKGCVLDSELAKFCKGEPNFYTTSQYTREYYKLANAKSYFADFENDPKTVITKGHRRYLIQREAGNKWQVIPKIYFEHLKNKGIKYENR